MNYHYYLSVNHIIYHIKRGQYVHVFVKKRKKVEEEKEDELRIFALLTQTTQMSVTTMTTKSPSCEHFRNPNLNTHHHHRIKMIRNKNVII